MKTKGLEENLCYPEAHFKEGQHFYVREQKRGGGGPASVLCQNSEVTEKKFGVLFGFGEFQESWYLLLRPK